MCVILIKEKGTELPDRELLERCWMQNPDGAGYMYNDGLAVHIRKGFMEVEELYDDLCVQARTERLAEKDVVFHFRIATSGSVDPETCHPYPLCTDIDALQAQRISCQTAVAHNGVIDIPQRDQQLNDSQQFIREYLSPVEKRFHPSTQEQWTHVFDGFKKRIALSKFAVMDPMNVFTYGTFFSYEGFLVSNLYFLDLAEQKARICCDDRFLFPELAGEDLWKVNEEELLQEMLEDLVPLRCGQRFILADGRILEQDLRSDLLFLMDDESQEIYVYDRDLDGLEYLGFLDLLL